MSLRQPQATTYDTALAEKLQRHSNSIEVLEHRPTTIWTSPTLENGWFATSGTAVSYRREGGVVRLRGRIKGGANSSRIFVLPVGFRPSTNELIAAAGYNGSQASPAFVNALPTGDVLIYYETGNLEVGIAGVTWVAEG